MTIRPPQSDTRNLNAPPRPNRSIICYTCGEPGHVSHQCLTNSTATNNTNSVAAPVAMTTTPALTTNNTQSLMQKLLRQLNATNNAFTGSSQQPSLN
jgi:hypothetical protein